MAKQQATPKPRNVRKRPRYVEGLPCPECENVTSRVTDSRYVARQPARRARR